MEKVSSILAEIEQLRFEHSEGVFNPFQFIIKMGEVCKEVENVDLDNESWENVAKYLNELVAFFGPIPFDPGLTNRPYMAKQN